MGFYSCRVAQQQQLEEKAGRGDRLPLILDVSIDRPAMTLVNDRNVAVVRALAEGLVRSPATLILKALANFARSRFIECTASVAGGARRSWRREIMGKQIRTPSAFQSSSGSARSMTTSVGVVLRPRRAIAPLPGPESRTGMRTSLRRHVLHFLESAAAASGVKKLQIVLPLLDTRLGGLLLGGWPFTSVVPQCFPQLSLAQRQAALRGWYNSGLNDICGLFRGVKAAILLTYYARVAPGASLNPTWPLIGYPGPPNPRPPVSALRRRAEEVINNAVVSLSAAAGKDR